MQYVRQLAEGETPPSADGVTPVTAIEAALNTYYIADQKENNLPEGVTLATGMILVTSDVTKAEGYVEGGSGSTSGIKPTVNVLSDSIETVNLHNTTAIAAVINQSKMADGDDMPEDLAVTVDVYGSFQPWGAVKQGGKLCIGGSGSAENIEITVAGASALDLASGAVKMIDISGDGRLVLGVDNFEEDDNPGDDGVSTTLESVTVSGGGGVSMAGLSGMSSLTMIDASASSGNNVFRSKADEDGLFPDVDDDELEALTMVKGGSGKDTVALATSVGGELESIGAGDDSVTIIGMLRSEGLTVDLGAGGDMLTGGGDADVFKYTSASQSQVAWTATGVMYGFDTITDFTSADDDISLGRTLFNGLHSQTSANLRTVDGDRREATAANRAIHSYDDDANADGSTTFATANSLRDWLGNGNGVFETVTGSGLTAATTQHAITIVNETDFRTLRADDDPAGAIDRDCDRINDAIGLYRTWILIDVNANGDFDASVDMAIAVTQDRGFSNTINLDDFGI